MKPFVRFGACGSRDASEEERKRLRLDLWDFDYRLQNILLGMLLEVVTPDEIPQLCEDRWKQNLVDFAHGRASEYETAVETGAGYPYIVAGRLPSIFDELGPNRTFLYLGCGAGEECIWLAQGGYKVIGIDTNEKLVELSNRWARYLGLDFQALQMNVLDLRLSEESFDGILLEFYGSWPSPDQILRIQSNLQRVLRPMGKIFIVASRKKYASFWHLMKDDYPARMARWLSVQSVLDHVQSGTDTHESRLLYGLFNTCHTVESLRSELSGRFEVLRCEYEKNDPRYVVAIARKKELCREKQLTDDMVDGFCAPKAGTIPFRGFKRERLAKIEDICTELDRHERSLIDYFMATEATRRTSPLRELGGALPGFLNLLAEILPCGEDGKSFREPAP